MSQGGGMDFNLAEEVLAVIPTDTYEQLDLARKITSMAIASRVSNMEGKMGRMRAKMYEKDHIIFELEDKLSTLQQLNQDAESRFKIAFEENAPKLSSSMEEISYTMAQSCSSSSYLDSTETIIKVEQFPKLVNPKLYTDANMAQLELMSIGNNPYAAAEAQPQAFFPQTPHPQPYLTLSLESQDLLAKFEDPYFSQVFAPMDVPELDSGNVEQQPFLEPVRSGGFGAREEADNPMIPDAFFDDFPADMFDQMEPLPNPST
ncbi:hypothetical protein GOBAR_DD09854 [Gossypium barbadense]|nr:hypothetical protein GOBAR_DD09854 [Gossypium barbadense]